MALLKSYGCGSISLRPPAIAMPCHPGPMAFSPMVKPALWLKNKNIKIKRLKIEELQPLLGPMAKQGGLGLGSKEQLECRSAAAALLRMAQWPRAEAASAAR